MKKLEIYDPAMCCSSGTCGPSIDPDLIRVSTLIGSLKEKGIEIIRHNLSQQPEDFVKNKKISALLSEKGVSALPVTVLDGEIVKTGLYPTNQEFAQWLGLSEIRLSVKKNAPSGCGCNGKTGCC